MPPFLWPTAIMADLARPDLCIIGAGALGIALARHARAAGADVLLVDRGVPEPGDAWALSVALTGLKHSAEAVRLVSRGDEFGFQPEVPKVRFKAVQERLVRLRADRAAENSFERLRALGIEIISGPTRFADASTLMVGEARLKPRRILLATGGVPEIPSIEGLGDISFFTPDSILENARKLSHLLVIGGGAEALALAQAYRRLGSDVTVVSHGQELAGYDPEAVGVLTGLLVEEGVRIIAKGTVLGVQKRAQGTGIIVGGADGVEERLDVSHILVAMGRSAQLSDMEAETGRLRVRERSDGYEIGGFGRTSNRIVRVVGAAAGINQWPQALSHGRAVIDALLGGRGRPAPAQTRLVLTDPALAQIGNLPAEGAAPRGEHRLVRASFAENAEALARGYGEGFVKVLVAGNGQIVGASAVGPGAAEIIAVLALAMDQGIELHKLENLPLPEPSLLSIIVALSGNHRATRSVSVWTERRQALRRYLPL
jgi:pyruvate/2-oxoglutarate dehydrogenase complex dihydrolipoamide dehydrogenase (E3) component